MQPADKRPEVVYRKTPTEEARRVRSALSRWQGYAPALGPLIVGFLLLLGLISALGFLSANKMYEVGMFARAAADQGERNDECKRGGCDKCKRRTGYHAEL